MRERGAWSEFVRFAVTPRPLWQALRTLEARVRAAPGWLDDWFALVSEYFWWVDPATGDGGGSVAAVDDVHCAVTVEMVGLRLFVLDRAILYDDILG